MAPPTPNPRRSSTKSGRGAKKDKKTTAASAKATAPPELAGAGGVSGEQDDSAPVVELLRLPPQEAQAILAEAGESAGKVWLALIYRLASLEAQVRDLAAELRARPAHGDSSTEVKQAVGSVNSGVERGSGSSAAPVAANFPPRARAAVDFDEGSKTEMLEKVFRKNWSLRQQDSPQG